MRDARQATQVMGPYSAYLDTGASVTVIDPGIVHGLGLESLWTSSLHVLGRETESHHDVCELEIAVQALEPRWIPLTVLSGPIYPKGTIAALGRDFLRHFSFYYDGARQQVTLTW